MTACLFPTVAAREPWSGRRCWPCHQAPVWVVHWVMTWLVVLLIVLALVFGVGAVLEGVLWVLLIGAALLAVAAWFAWQKFAEVSRSS